MNNPLMMETFMSITSTPFTAYISVCLGTVLFLSMMVFAIISKLEEEPLATRRAILLAFILPLPFLIAGFIEFKFQNVICLSLEIITLLTVIYYFLPIGNKDVLKDEIPQTQIDERDIMFSRNTLEEGTEHYERYYEKNPSKIELDKLFRNQPGLLKEGALFYDPITFAVADANFKTVSALHKILQEKSQSKVHDVDPVKMTQFIKKWIKGLGAISVGVTKLQKYHQYSTIGRGDRYGEKVELQHEYAIAITVEMDKFLLDRAPKGPTVVESAQQYLTSGILAVQLAEFIRNLGYSSRAHIDGSYRVLCPLVARDAGLGEIGRMGLLMTPELGPRVRLAVVTTDLPLIVSKSNRDNTVMDFCTHCKKCADICPSNAISFEDRNEIDGAMRWQINSEKCFTYWCKVGTDCGLCMSVCPYSHPNSSLHNLVRFGLKRSRQFRKLALKLDDYFYGRKPARLDTPGWMNNITLEKSE